jgi:hypothetical protein
MGFRFISKITKVRRYYDHEATTSVVNFSKAYFRAHKKGISKLPQQTLCGNGKYKIVTPKFMSV